MYKISCFVIFFASLFVASCTLDARYSVKNPVDIPVKWHAKDNHYKNKATKLACTAWWKQYHDPMLNQLIELSLKYNNDINTAMGNIQAAQGELKRIKLNWIPTMTGNIGYSSFPALGYPGVLAFILPTYTMNIFTQIKEQQQAHYKLNVSKTMRDGVKLAVIAQVSESYFSYLALRERLQLLRSIEHNLSNKVRIYRTTYHTGLTSDISLVQANSDLNTIRAQEQVTKNDIIFARNSIRYLLNQNPCPLKALRHFDQVDPYKTVIGSIPLNVIEHRPDVAEARNNLKAANEGIGVALSHFLPTIQLSMARGEISKTLNGGSFGKPIYFNQAIFQQPLVTLTTLGEVEKTRGLNKAAYYHYLNTIRAALRDVDNDLSAHDLYTKRLEETITSKNNIQQLYQLNLDLYHRGIISYLDLLDKKSDFEQMKIIVNRHKLAQILITVNLYQDLAVGYHYVPRSPCALSKKNCFIK